MAAAKGGHASARVMRLRGFPNLFRARARWKEIREQRKLDALGEGVAAKPEHLRAAGDEWAASQPRKSDLIHHCVPVYEEWRRGRF